MTAPTIVLESAIGDAGIDWFELDDSTRGVLNTSRLADSFSTTGAFVDLSARCYRIETRRGRQRLFEQADAGWLTAELDNSDRALDSTNLSGPYVDSGVSLIQPMRTVRLRALYGTNHVDLPGTASDYISTPHNTNLAITDLNALWAGTAKWQNGGTDTLAGKYGAAGQRSWRIRRIAADLQVEWSTDGTATDARQFTNAFAPYPNDEHVSVLVNFDVDAVGGWTMGVATSGISGSFSDSTSAGVTTSIFNASSTPLTLGQANAANALDGHVDFFGLSENRQWRCYFTAAWVIGTTMFGYPTGETWTLQGAAVSTGSPVGIAIWQGFADEWLINWMDPQDSICNLRATDGFKILSRVDNPAASPAGAGETTGDRIERILDAAGWPTADRVIETGNSTVQDTTLAANAMTELILTADTEMGLVLIGEEGKVEFWDRHHWLTATHSVLPLWIFGDADDDVEIPYTNLVISHNDDLVYNSISIARVGGSAQTASDSSSIQQHLTRTFTRTDLTHQTDTESLDYANVVLAQSKDSELRFDALTIASSGDDRMWPVLLYAQVGDRCIVRRRPPGGGDVIERECFIEGVAHSVSPPTTWVTTYQLSDASNRVGFILNDAVLGVLDEDSLTF